jgi:hypothetical protein
MWDLPEHPERGEEPGQAVVVTLTDYNRHLKQDIRLLQILRRAYKHVAVWPQGSKDLRYVRSLDLPLEIIPPGLASFDRMLEEGRDYVGTRLHAGIRALQLGARSTIVAVDNRAREIAKDTGLPIVDRGLIDAEETLFGRRKVALNLPRKNVEFWLSETRSWLEEPMA